jgi:glycosyltransferase involved in cell wall biosynthesis
MHDEKIEVLLSTYNGEKFVRDQIASIQSQTVDSVFINIRDDGSTDRTIDIVRSYSLDNDNIEIDENKNVGVVGSFFHLLYSTGKDSEFVAFSDQDDVWHKDKLEIAVRRLAKVKPSVPAMYCCRTRLVDENLKFLGYGHGLPRPASLGNAILQNIATGCTIVLNRSAVDILCKYCPNIDKVLMHDWWIYLVISCFGEVIFDDNAHIDYRQHGGNVVGVSVGPGLWIQRFKRAFIRDNRRLIGQVEEFFRLYGNELSEKQRMLCLDFLNEAGSSNLFSRLRYAVRAPIYRQSLVDDFIFRILLVIGIR